MSSWRDRAQPVQTQSWRDRAQPVEEPGLLSKGLDYGLRALDYGGGLMRAGAAGASDLLRLGKAGIDPDEEMADFKTSVRSGDLGRMVSGQAPSSA